MTIHSDWARVLHEECPQAFKKGDRVPKGEYDVGIIDGHLQMMRLHGKLPSWTKFIEYLFLKPVKKLFEAGCPVVVLCFDSYDSVPLYKGITQACRVASSSADVHPFGIHEELPSTIPEDTTPYLLNRNFKIKLVEMVCDRLPRMLLSSLTEEQTLLIDYKRVASYTRHSLIPVILDHFEPMGESDVKFCRYVKRYGNALVHAIDGDYMVIALLYYAKHGLFSDNRILIYRHLAIINSTAASASAKQKRKKPAEAEAEAEEEMEEAEEAEEGLSEPKAAKAKRKQAPKCWVDMQMLFAVIARAAWMSVGTRPVHPLTMRPFTDADAVVAIVHLMLCAGTDFSRGLPLVGPRRLWDMLPDLMLQLLMTTRVTEDFERFAEDVVGCIYALAFRNHVPKHMLLSGTRPLPIVLGVLLGAGCKLGAKTKQRLPNGQRVLTTVKNIAWVIHYWSTLDGCVETPTDGTWGFLASGTASRVRFQDGGGEAAKTAS